MTKKQTLIQQLISGALFIGVIVMLGWLSVRYKTELDWTAGKRNSLSAATEKQLAAMPDPIKFSAFVGSGDAEVRHGLEFDVGRYQRVKKNVTLEFIDPSAQPQKVREMNVSASGELVVEYQGRHENLRASTEPIITTALQRLAYSGEQWVVFLEGHGERSIADAQNQSALGKFAEALRGKGLKLQSLNLARTPKIPDNTSVLVLASPEKEPLEAETKLITEFVEKGGNLLWLADTDFPAGMTSLSKLLGVQWQDGLVIDPIVEKLGLPGGFYVPGEYPNNPVTQGLEHITVFPLVRSVAVEKNPAWTMLPLLDSTADSWLETQAMKTGKIERDDKDIKGPLHVGVTLTHERKDNADKTKSFTQRVALIGDVDFLSNAYLDQQGNRQLGLNIVQWLASRDAQLNIDIPKAQDASLYLPPWAVIVIAGGFVVVLPLLLIGLGVSRWIIRRRK